MNDSTLDPRNPFPAPSIGAESVYILTPEELAARPSREPNYISENEALIALANVFIESPQTVLQRLADTALKVCRADSAGISIDETERGENVFRWHATAGILRTFQGGTMPRNFSPCGTVLDRNSALHITDPAKLYPYIEGLVPHICEVLLVPFYRGERPIGTVWVVAHTESRKFDAEDLRLIERLGLLAAAAIITLTRTEAAERSERERARLVKVVDAERARLADLFRQSPSFMAVLAGPSHVFELVNDQYQKLVGNRDIIGKPVGDALPEVKEQGFIDLLDLVYRTGESFVGQGVRVHLQLTPDNPPRELLLDFVYQAIRGADGVINGVFVQGVDRTEHTKTERALRASEEFLRRIFESSRDCIKVLSLDGRLQSVNDAGQQLLELDSLESCQGADWCTFWNGASHQMAEHALSEARAGRTGSLTGYCPTFKGTPKWWDVQVTPILGSDGLAQSLLVVSRDITQQKQFENELSRLLSVEQDQSSELQRLNGELSDQDRRKDEFLATLAHELRNPLAPIRTGLQVLRSAKLDSGDAVKIRDMMDRQLTHLVRLVDDLMDVSRVSRGKVELRKEPVSVQAIVASAVEGTQPLIAAGGHTLDVSVPNETVSLVGDRTRLSQVVINLLTNSAKYTPPGGRIDLVARGDGTEIVIAVKDSGIGIAREMLPKVFELFTQVGSSLDRSQGGLGIGLSLVRRLVEMHGGSITADSPGLGHGSTFTVRLPIARPSANL